MIFGSRQMSAKLQFYSLPFMGKDIIPTDTAKDLGVILDSNLTYGAIHSTKISGLRCENFLVSNGS